MGLPANAYSYKFHHEEFMQNHNGTTAAEVLLVIFPATIGIFLSTSLCAVLMHLINQKVFTALKLVTWLPFLVDFITIVVPVVLCVTICNDRHTVVSLIFLLGLFVCVAYCGILCRQMCFKDIVTPLLATLVIPEKRPYLTNFRSIINLITAICILAVDFKVFPRRFAKTETFGYGLMDTGVGFFVISNAIVTPEALGYKGKSQAFTDVMWKTVKSSVPLLILGSARFFVTQQIDYQVHVSEYGVHWNFFVTLAMTKILCNMILNFVGSDYSVIISIVVIGMHELMLCSGCQDWVLSNEARQDFLSANREGIASLLGYIALYFAGISLGQQLRNYISNIQGYLYLIGKLAFISVLLWFATSLCENWFGVSRRLANIGYVTWILAFSITTLMILVSIELLALTLNMVVKANMKNKWDRQFHFTISYVPLTLEAVNYNGLLFFLLANLLTGLINICVYTLTTGVLQSLSIICGYIFLLCSVTVLLYFKKMKLKVW
jgi:hypothetical protein